MSHRTSPATIRIPSIFSCLAAALLIPGCAGKVAKPQVPANTDASSLVSLEPAPDANSPSAAVQRLSWCWNHLDRPRYGDLFTDDFRFGLAASDSAGNLYRASGWLRADELEMARHLFETGTLNLPPAMRIDLRMSPSPPLPDPRPGRTFAVHRVIRAPVELTVVTTAGFYRATGLETFYLVRGDSAEIPVELRERGFTPDPTRWWIERWDEETVPMTAGSPALALPARATTWGAIKVLYR